MTMLPPNFHHAAWPKHPGRYYFSQLAHNKNVGGVFLVEKPQHYYEQPQAEPELLE